MLRDPQAHAHAERVREYAIALARGMGMKDPLVLDAIGGSALVHDVGKLAMPDDVLNKPGPLTEAEYDRIKQHVVIGADLLSAPPLPRAYSIIVRHHHEHWDGSGYPDRLKGEAIPIGARVLALADCYDALTSWRPYRDALTHDEAVSVMFERRGTAFEPGMVDTFLKILQRLREGMRPVRPALVRLV
jgi:putative nucleotidyltransferase with HDIG domain